MDASWVLESFRMFHYSQVVFEVEGVRLVPRKKPIVHSKFENTPEKQILNPLKVGGLYIPRHPGPPPEKMFGPP